MPETPDPTQASIRHEGVVVISPTPRLTVTIERGTDDEPEIHLHAGGQGVWVARMAALLGAPATLCAPFGGETGRVLPLLLEDDGVTVAAIACSGPNGAYCHDRRSDDRIEIADVPTPPLNRHEADDFYDRSLGLGLNAGVVVLTGMANPGVIPDEFFGRLANDLGSNGTIVVADLSGDSLLALDGGVHLLKVSHTELVASGLADSEAREALIEAMDTLTGRGIANVLVSYAEHPALALIDGTIYEVVTPVFEALDHRGAGDSMTAAMAVALSRGASLVGAIQLGGAAGALNVTRHGLGTGVRESIERIAARVEVRPVA